MYLVYNIPHRLSGHVYYTCSVTVYNKNLSLNTPTPTTTPHIIHQIKNPLDFRSAGYDTSDHCL